jgi:hypothetical protein
LATRSARLRQAWLCAMEAFCINATICAKLGVFAPPGSHAPNTVRQQVVTARHHLARPHAARLRSRLAGQQAPHRPRFVPPE